MRASSYNIHQCVGKGGRFDPDRVARVIGELDSSIVGLQEVGPGSVPESGMSQMDHLAEATGLRAIPGPTMLKKDGYYGNVLLTSFKVVEVRHHDLSVTGREPRGAIDAVLDLGGAHLRVVVTHLGLRISERRRQVERLLQVLDGGDNGRPVLLLADINEWIPGSKSLRSLDDWFGRAPAPGTFPSGFPSLPLDRIWVRPRESIFNLRVHNSLLARRASDHLPVKAAIDVGPPGEK